MEEDHSTPSSHTLLHMAAGLLPMAAAPLSLLLFTFSHTLTFSLSFCSHIMPLFIDKYGELLQHTNVNMEGTIKPQNKTQMVALNIPLA
jgi:hypothetical protein